MPQDAELTLVTLWHGGGLWVLFRGIRARSKSGLVFLDSQPIQAFQMTQEKELSSGCAKAEPPGLKLSDKALLAAV